MRMLAAVVLVTAALAGVSCGGDGNDSGQGGSSKRAIQADAQQQAESMVLLLSDFPEGWRASASEEDKAAQDKFRKCIGASYSEFTITGEADSKDFAHEDSTEASSSAAAYEDASQATNALKKQQDAMAGSGVEDCFRTLLQEALAKDKTRADEIEIGDIDLGELNVTKPANVDEVKAWQVAIPFTLKSGALKGLSPTEYIDLVEMRKGAKMTQLNVSDVLSPFDPDLRNELLQVLADRMSGAY
jgi:hypothetical protein